MTKFSDQCDQRLKLTMESKWMMTREEVETLLMTKLEANQAETGLFKTEVGHVVVDRVAGQIKFDWFDQAVTLDGEIRAPDAVFVRADPLQATHPSDVLGFMASVCSLFLFCVMLMVIPANFADPSNKSQWVEAGRLFIDIWWLVLMLGILTAGMWVLWKLFQGVEMSLPVDARLD